MKLYAGQQIHFSFKDAETDHEGMEKNVSCSDIQRRIVVATLPLDKRDHKQKTVITVRCSGVCHSPTYSGGCHRSETSWGNTVIPCLKNRTMKKVTRDSECHML